MATKSGPPLFMHQILRDQARLACGHNTLHFNDMYISYDPFTSFLSYPTFQCQKTVLLFSYKIYDLDFPRFTYSPIYVPKIIESYGVH